MSYSGITRCKNMWRKITAVNFAILLVIIALNPYFIIQNRGYPELWDAPIRVMDSDWEPVWYLQPKTGIRSYGCIGVSNNIQSVLRKESSELFTEIYVNHVPNIYTNTVYISLTDTSADTTDRVIDLLDPRRGVTVEFIEAPAPLHQVVEWRREMRDLWKILRYRGVQLNSLSLTPNGTILLGISNVTQEKIEILEWTIEGIVPPGILVVHEVGELELLLDDVEFVVFEGLLGQEYHPDYPPRDPNGTNVITLDVFDPEDNLSYETYYLRSKEGQFYRYTPRDERIQDTVWDYTGPKPVKITGIQSLRIGVNGSSVETLMIMNIEYSELGRWFDGVLVWKEVEVGAFEYHNKLYTGRNMTLIFLTLNAEAGETFDEVYLASHEGYIYDVLICGTGQPIAVVNRGQSVKIRGLLTEVVDSNNNLLPILVVFEAT
jgi:hypothetical protein